MVPSMALHSANMSGRSECRASCIESAYENEHEATEQRLRTQAYQAVLSGAAGQIFGNNPIWHFSSGGLYQAPVTWQQALHGARQSMTICTTS